MIINMNYQEIKNKHADELQKMLLEQREVLRDLRFKDANKQLKDIRQIRKTRQAIAQILMLLRAKKNDRAEAQQEVKSSDK